MILLLLIFGYSINLFMQLRSRYYSPSASAPAPDRWHSAGYKKRPPIRSQVRKITCHRTTTIRIWNASSPLPTERHAGSMWSCHSYTKAVSTKEVSENLWTVHLPFRSWSDLSVILHIQKISKVHVFHGHICKIHTAVSHTVHTVEQSGERCR